MKGMLPIITASIKRVRAQQLTKESIAELWEGEIWKSLAVYKMLGIDHYFFLRTRTKDGLKRARLTAPCNWVSNMLAALSVLLLLVPLTSSAASPEQRAGVGGVTVGQTRADLFRAIPGIRCSPPVNGVESCETGTDMLPDMPLRKAKGSVGFVLDRGVVEVIVVKVPASFHSQIIADLNSRFGKPKRYAESSAAGASVNLIWRAGRGRVVASDRPGKQESGGYVISR